MKIKTVLDMCQNYIINAVVGNLTTAPTNPKKGQFYYNSVKNCLMIYNGTKWVNYNPLDAFEFGKGTEGVLQIQKKINDTDAPTISNVELITPSNYEEAGAAAQAYASARSYTDTKISALVNSAPETLDTLAEVAAAIEDNEDAIAAIQELVSAGVHKSRVANPALTPASGVCTWVCNHGLTLSGNSSAVLCDVYTVSGEKVICDITINSASNVIIRIASDATIKANEYYAVFVG